MLNSIRNMIKEKESYMEATANIFGDLIGGDIDDLIVLGESNDIGEEPVIEEDTDAIDDNEPSNDNTGDDSTDVMNSPIDDNDNPDEPEPNTDIMDQPVGDDETPAETPLPIPGDESIPPVENPPVDNTDDILSTTIDLKTNTPNDTLPIPPANAAEALPGDDGDNSIISQKVDSGFGGDVEADVENDNDSIDIMDQPIENDDSITEKANILLSADKLKGYHIEDVPYLIYSASCRNENRTPVSKDEFNKSSKFKDFKSKVYSSVANFIRNEKFTLVAENTDTIIFDQEAIRESVKVDQIPLMEMNEISYDVYTTICEMECSEPMSKEAFYENSEAVPFRNAIDDRIASQINGLISKAVYTEGITLGGESDETVSDDESARSGSEESETPPDVSSDGEENEVTSAVRDKVNESEDGGLEDFDDTGEVSGSPDKIELLKKLGNITKSIEDTKKDIMDALQ